MHGCPGARLFPVLSWGGGGGDKGVTEQLRCRGDSLTCSKTLFGRIPLVSCSEYPLRGCW